ncbi:unnamed protein product [Ectocarpus sp. 4 AP-2014]
MTPARPAAVVLALVAVRVASFVHQPAFSSPHAIASSTHRRAVGPHAPKAATLSAAAMTTTTTASCRCNTARMMMRMWGATQQSRLLPQHHRPAAFGRQTAAAPTNAAQLVTVRTLSTTRRTMPNTAVLADGQQQQPAGGRPAGGYPPPEHLHGIFAVYKPKGFSSADVVQKIKNVLTRGVREEIQTRLALERGGMVSEEVGAGEKKAEAPAAAGKPVEGSSKEGEGEGSESPKKSRKRPRRRQPGPKVKVGHGGTLDPMATGVLVIGVGKGCRELSNFLQGGKGYCAEALLGHETNTQDALGEATVHGEWEHVTKEDVDAALGQFTGDIMQVPPMFSALHKDGQRLYELARKGITVEREARQVRVDSLRQTDPALPLPLLGLELECGGGFYVRTLIEDLGRALRTRAHMTALERTKQGPFELQHALRLEEWEYDRLCKHLGDAPGILDRLGAMTGRGTEDSSAAVTDRAATAVEG